MQSPFILSLNKPVGITSYDVIRDIKRNMPWKYEKVGHFGTLDPFACGVLMLGFNGASRLNDLIHEYLPKTYLAIGKLGITTDTGDRTGEIIARDESRYFQDELSRLPKEYIEQKLREKFVGDYLQAPPIYSAAKFQGKALHEWAREGVEIKKEPVLRHIYSLEVVKYAHPYLCIRATVGSGTYIRVLFQDCAEYFGTHGTLIGLVRESVGHIKFQNALIKKNWPKGKDDLSFDQKNLLAPKDVLPFEQFELNENEFKRFRNGNPIAMPVSHVSKKEAYKWIVKEGKELGLARVEEGMLQPSINFAANFK